MQHPELPFFAFLSAILVLIPSLWHWRSRNVAVLALIFWLSLSDIINGVNTIVWAGNVRNPIPVWCDITTKFIVGTSFALPLATLCICKHLEMISSTRKVSYDLKDRQRRMIFEVIMCFGLPVIFMALHYIVQGHRFDIFENTGCQATIYVSIPGILIVWFPQLLFSVITLIYAALALRNFIRRRLTFAAHLQNSNSALTTTRYLRLITMALVEIVWTTSLTSYNLWNNTSGGLRPWISWANVHSNFSRVAVFTLQEFPPQFAQAMILFWWTLPASSFIFFIFFGLGEEARKEYKKGWLWITKSIRRAPAAEKKISLDTYSNKHVPKPLHLVSLNTSNSSSHSGSTLRGYPSKLGQTLSDVSSPMSPTLTSSSGGFYAQDKKRFLEACGDIESQSHYDPVPSYFLSTTNENIGVSIDATRPLPHSSSNVSDISRISYPHPPNSSASDSPSSHSFTCYGNDRPSPTASLSLSPTLSSFAPEPPVVTPPHSLPPPPRRTPRHAGSKGSVKTASTAAHRSTEDLGPAPDNRTHTNGVMITIQHEEQTHEDV